jgi:pyruvate/2-oxoglutarate dehydrogenase complex dihydrolipoamide acyltransferase (E2) component
VPAPAHGACRAQSASERASRPPLRPPYLHPLSSPFPFSSGPYRSRSRSGPSRLRARVCLQVIVPFLLLCVRAVAAAPRAARADDTVPARLLVAEAAAEAAATAAAAAASAAAAAGAGEPPSPPPSPPLPPPPAPLPLSLLVSYRTCLRALRCLDVLLELAAHSFLQVRGALSEDASERALSEDASERALSEDASGRVDSLALLHVRSLTTPFVAPFLSSPRSPAPAPTRFGRWRVPTPPSPSPMPPPRHRRPPRPSPPRSCIRPARVRCSAHWGCCCGGRCRPRAQMRKRRRRRRQRRRSRGRRTRAWARAKVRGSS